MVQLYCHCTVTNKVFIVFSSKEILLDTNTFSISTSPKKILGDVDVDIFKR